MKTYLAEFNEDGITYDVSFPAMNWRTAENIARKKGWKVVGTFEDEVSCPDDVFAMIEKHIYKPSIH